MIKNIFKKIIFKTLIISLCFSFSVFVDFKNIYATEIGDKNPTDTEEEIDDLNDADTAIDLKSELSVEELESIQEFKDLQEMVSHIFEINTIMGTEDLQDPIMLMFTLVSRILEYWDKEFVKSTLYKLLVGLSMMFLITNFCIKIYEEQSLNLDLKINSSIMIKKYIQIIFAILLIYNLKIIVYFILGFFRFILRLCINYTSANFIGAPESIEVINPKRIAFEILKENEIVKTNVLLDEVMTRSKESSLRSQYMIPWVFSWISKLALIVVIFINSIKLFVHCAFYVVTLGDFIGDIKRSKFVEYTKTLIALVLEEAVIVIVLYLSNLLLNPYLHDLLIEGISSGGLTFITLAMIFTGVSMSKVFVIIGSSHMSKKIVGVA